MKPRSRAILGSVLGLALVGLLGAFFIWPLAEDVDVIERTGYRPPVESAEGFLVDDQLENKQTTFDPALVDRRPLEGWLVNSSDAVIRLDVTMVRPDTEGHLLVVRPSYAAALDEAKRAGVPAADILPSVNLIDGKAKQFDDGLYAALDQAYYRGLKGRLTSHVQLIRGIYDEVGPASPAEPLLAAGLELAGVKVEPANSAAKDTLLQQFVSNEVQSKPIGFYNWNSTLRECFRFLRFFQQPIRDRATAQAITDALSRKQALLSDYRKALAFYSRLTNPPADASVLDLIERKEPLPPDATIVLFPASTSRETELFLKLFPRGLPADADLMKELIRRIRSGQVDLTPRPASGWYDYQVHALETLLLPEKGQEAHKLMLTRAYKKRMLEAFKALVTKRRETHVRQVKTAEPKSAAMPQEKLQIAPRLRLEPCPSYYLRTARGYAFLATFLESALQGDTLKTLHGLREGTPPERGADLRTELHEIRDLFYGFHLLSAEDIGMKPLFLEGETINREQCEGLATRWLASFSTDPDLARDTRVAVPLYVDPFRGVTRLWVTIGVRLTRLKADFARGPRIKPKEGPGDWSIVPAGQLGERTLLIAVDEFAEVEIPGNKVLTRDELRTLCDSAKTRDAIIKSLQNQ